MKPTKNRKELKRKFTLWAARFGQKMVSGGQLFFVKRVHRKSNLFLSVSLDFEITKATPKVTAPTANTLTYNGEAQELVSAGSTDFGTMLYSLTEEGEFTATIPTGTNAVSYTVYYYVQGNENANDSAVASVTVKINKAVASITAAPTPNTLTYSGEAQYLINAGEAVGGTVVYSLTEDGEYTTSIPQGTNAGDYTVWYYVQGDANHNDSAKDSVSVNIAKAPLTVTADAKAKIYGDEDPTLTYTEEGLLGGDTLSSALTGALSREEGQNVGLYAITLGTLSADNYTISFVEADLFIHAKEVTEPIVTLDQTSYQYDGNVKEPKVISIVVDGRTLTEGIDYTISYENNVYVNTEATVSTVIVEHSLSMVARLPVTVTQFLFRRVPLSRSMAAALQEALMQFTVIQAAAQQSMVVNLAVGNMIWVEWVPSR